MSDTHRGHITYCPTCKKFAHISQDEAHAHRRSLIKAGKHNTKHGALTVYRCPHGKGWHVGHSTR